MTGEGVQGGHEHDHGVLWAMDRLGTDGQTGTEDPPGSGPPVTGMWAEPRGPWLRHSDRAGTLGASAVKVNRFV